jgi:Phosphoserine phosphatase RsbU, N-terminal domain
MLSWWLSDTAEPGVESTVLPVRRAMNGATEPFRASYASVLRGYLADPDEGRLFLAYELGREAVNRNLSVLELAVVHHEAVLSTLREGEPTRIEPMAQAAGDFFLESLSAFEMVQRELRDVRSAALLERRQIEMSRQLSSFLADASLALNATDALEEVLRLVAEQARELVGADCCLATLTLQGQPRAIEASACSDSDASWTPFIRWLDLFGVYRAVRSAGGSVRMSEQELNRLALFRFPTSDRPLRGWLAASLTALDGSELGAIQLFNKCEGDFTGTDLAVLIHLAQMASAAVERALLYQ